MSTMEQLVLSGPHSLAWETADRPAAPGPSAATVRPVAVATCDFDHLLVSGRATLPLPLAIGHECVAEVVEVGESVSTVSRGDVVVVAFQVACGTCDRCRAGHTTSCRAVPWLSGYGLGRGGGDFGGVAADLVHVPYADAMLTPLPPGLAPAQAAAVSCNLPDAYRCVAPQLAQEPGAPVLVCGGAFGSIGLYAVAIARALGAEQVTYLDRDPARAARAAALGALVTTDPGDIAPASHPITVDASQDPELLAVAVRATAQAGTCTVSTMYPAALTGVPLMDLFARAATLHTGQPDVAPLVGPVLELLADGRLDPDLATDDVTGWDRAPEAWAAGAGKVVCVR